MIGATWSIDWERTNHDLETETKIPHFLTGGALPFCSSKRSLCACGWSNWRKFFDASNFAIKGLGNQKTQKVGFQIGDFHVTCEVCVFFFEMKGRPEEKGTTQKRRSGPPSVFRGATTPKKATAHVKLVVVFLQFDRIPLCCISFSYFFSHKPPARKSNLPKPSDESCCGMNWMNFVLPPFMTGQRLFQTHPQRLG